MWNVCPWFDTGGRVGVSSRSESILQKKTQFSKTSYLKNQKLQLKPYWCNSDLRFYFTIRSNLAYLSGNRLLGSCQSIKCSTCGKFDQVDGKKNMKPDNLILSSNSIIIIWFYHCWINSSIFAKQYCAWGNTTVFQVFFKVYMQYKQIHARLKKDEFQLYVETILCTLLSSS